MRIFFLFGLLDNSNIQAARLRRTGRNQTKKMKLLIVEDNVPMRRLIKSIVSDLANEILECGDGADVLGAYEQHLPEWILMDVKMPRTDGIAASRLILSQYPQAKICIVTECSDAKTRQAARDAGARDYVLKDNLLNIRAVIGKEKEKTN
jgi:CheY-like chemotaxis protein